MRTIYSACVLSALVLCTALFSSCRERIQADFVWLDAEGKSRSFTISSRKTIAQNAGAGAASRPGRIDRYTLAEPIIVYQGRAVAVDIERGDGPSTASGEDAEARVKLSLSEKSDGVPAFLEATFPIAARNQRFYLRPRPGAKIASLTVQSLGPPSFRIKGISTPVVFSGIEERDGLLSVSSGFRMTTGGGMRTLGIEKPFAGLDAASEAAGLHSAALLVDYGPAQKGASGRQEMLVTARRGGSAETRLSLRLGPGGGATVIGPELLPAGADAITAVIPHEREVGVFCVRAVDAREYRRADLGRVLASGMPPEGEDYTVFTWDAFPSVLILVFKDYDAQDRRLKRLAFFVEKAGYRGALHSDDVISKLHGWNAHDYRTQDLAAFFNAARERNFPLSSEEWELERLLAEYGLISLSDGKLSAGMGALISISLETPAALRRTLLVHESLHGIFFVDEQYRAYVGKTWAAMSEDEKWFWKTYFGWAAYDTSDEYLMVNEFQAYLLQQPLSAVQEYFTRRKVDELLASRPALRERIDSYMSKYASFFEARARALDSYLRDNYGLEAGRTYRLALDD
jgi:hypothetical protein